MNDVSSRTISVVLIQLLATFGDNPLQFVGFFASQRTSSAVDDGVALLIGDQLEAVDVVCCALQIGGRESLQILNGVELGHRYYGANGET